MPSTITEVVQRNALHTDAIAEFFDCDSIDSSCDIRADYGDDWRMQIVSPYNPIAPVNLEYRYNWQIVKVTGIDDTVDHELSTETSKFSDGFRYKGSRRKEREISITVKVCPCDNCDYLEHKRELIQISKCQHCALSDCQICCSNGELCFDDFAMKDLRSCHLRIKCCDVIRQIPVRLKGKIKMVRKGSCHYYTIKYVAADPNFHYPRIQTVEFTLDDDDLVCPVQLRGEVDLSRINGFKKCINIPYTGTVRGYPKFTIKGEVDNLRITNSLTGAEVNLNRREDPYTIDGCAPHILNFWRGQQQYTDNGGQNIYQDLAGGCSNVFYFPVDCDGEVEICIEGEAVNPGNFFLKIQWWIEYDEFYGMGDLEPANTIVTIDDCDDGCIHEEHFTVADDELTCPDKLISDNGNIDLSQVNEFSKCVTLPYYRPNMPTYPKIVVRGCADSLVITRGDTGESWDFTDADVLADVMSYPNCQVRILDYSPNELLDCDVPGVSVPDGVFTILGDVPICITGKNIDPDEFEIIFTYSCSRTDEDTKCSL